MPSKLPLASLRVPSAAAPSSGHLPTPAFSKVGNREVGPLVEMGFSQILPKPSGMVSIAIGPPAAPFHHGVPSPVAVVIPASPGAPPQLQVKLQLVVPPQKPHVTFEDLPRQSAVALPTGSCDVPTEDLNAALLDPTAQSQFRHLPPAASPAIVASLPPHYYSAWDLGLRLLGLNPRQSLRKLSRRGQPLFRRDCKRPTLGFGRRWLRVQCWLVRAVLTDEIIRVMLHYVRQQTPHGWTTLEFNGDATYWRDTVLTYTTWRVPDRPVGAQQELLEPFQERKAAGVEPPPPPPMANR